jgi:hypothetical protein
MFILIKTNVLFYYKINKMCVRPMQIILKQTPCRDYLHTRTIY